MSEQVRKKILPQSKVRFNELPPIPGLEPWMFDIYGRTTFFLEGQTHNNVYLKYIGQLHRLYTHPVKGAMMEFQHNDAPKRQTKIRQKIFVLNQIPPGMFFFSMNDKDFGRNVQKYWDQIESCAIDWWWTACIESRYNGRHQSSFGFVFRSEGDAVMFSQLFTNVDITPI